METLTDTEQYGGTFEMPVTGARHAARQVGPARSRTLGSTRARRRSTSAYRLNDHWSVSTGVRDDERRDDSPVVPLTQEQGERTDAVVQLGYDSQRRWSAYGFVQDTIESTATARTTAASASAAPIGSPSA